jgi:endogenous inhibitor of DNA gyrase (YacG/DUF329 family)
MSEHHTALRAVLPVRACAVCGAFLQRHANESASSFKGRKTCSPNCGHLLLRRYAAERRVSRETKSCKRCGATMRWKNGSEAWNVFDKRMFCGKRCWLADQREKAFAQARRHAVLPRCADAYCGHPLSDPSTQYCTANDNPVCWRRRQPRVA